MTHTRPGALGLMCLVALTTTIGQLLLKSGANALPAIFSNINLLLGVSLYGITAVLFMLALRGGEVSILIPILATNYIWVPLIGMTWFGETVSITQWAGVVVIIAGIVVMTREGT